MSNMDNQTVFEGAAKGEHLKSETESALDKEQRYQMMLKDSMESAGSTVSRRQEELDRLTRNRMLERVGSVGKLLGSTAQMSIAIVPENQQRQMQQVFRVVGAISSGIGGLFSMAAKGGATSLEKNFVMSEIEGYSKSKARTHIELAERQALHPDLTPRV